MSEEQKTHWDETYGENATFFGEEPSGFAREALHLFRAEGVHEILELGSGQGRDTLFFAESGLGVAALDYSETAVAQLNEKARAAGLSSRAAARLHDLRTPLPYPDNSFDACYSHMLLCMELTAGEIAFILGEIRRVLRPGGLNLFSVRSTFDKHYRAGTSVGEETYDVGGFVVRFFSEDEIGKLAGGYEFVGVSRMEEGSLPRDLFAVALRKPAEARRGSANIGEEDPMADPMAKFQEFFDATYNTGVLDRKTKHLVALGASLAIACDT